MFSVSEFFGDCVVIPFFLFGFVFDRLRPASPCVCFFLFVGTSSYGGHWWWVRRVYSPPVPTRRHTHTHTHTRNGTSGTKSKLELWEFSYLSLSLLLLLRLLESKIGLELVPDRRVMTSFTVVDVVVFVLVLILICEGRGGGGDFL